MTRVDILQTAIDIYGISAQEDMLLEEMAELQKAVLKLRRVDSVTGALSDLEDVREEIADVQIMLDQMRLIYGDTTEQEAFKLERLEKRMEGETNDPN